MASTTYRRPGRRRGGLRSEQRDQGSADRLDRGLDRTIRGAAPIPQPRCRQGIARRFDAYLADRGCTLAGIGVDTDRPDAAENLFEGMGYVLDDRMVLYGGVFDQ